VEIPAHTPGKSPWTSPSVDKSESLPLLVPSFSLAAWLLRYFLLCILLGRWLKATAFTLPLSVVVFTVRHHLKDENLMTRKQHPYYEPILVSTDVEDDTIADVISGSKIYLNVIPIVPIDRAMTEVGVPRS
jgi:hypothetical protein